MAPDDSAVEELQWFSIKEAATYLGVSQPTVFRWMKDGVLSFYKVGGSTRFSKENLEAVIQKNTGSQEATAARANCAACGHHSLIEGRMQGTGRLYFKPSKVRFWTLQESLVPTNAKVCEACGYVQLHVDVDKLRSLKPAAKDEKRTDKITRPELPPGEPAESQRNETAQPEPATSSGKRRARTS